MVLQLEVLIIGAQINDTLNKSDNCRNSSPAEAEIQNSHSNFSHIEFMDSNSSQENSKKSCCNLALDRPCRIDPCHIHLLRCCLLDDNLRLRLIRLLVWLLVWLLIRLLDTAVPPAALLIFSPQNLHSVAPGSIGAPHCGQTLSAIIIFPPKTSILYPFCDFGTATFFKNRSIRKVSPMLSSYMRSET